MTFKCACGEVYKKITTNPNLSFAPCPSCKKNKKSFKLLRMGDGEVDAAALAPHVVPKGIAPGIIGSNTARAIDATAEIVMQDHKLTDLKDNIRAGEAMAPKLDPVRQQAADSMFSGKKRATNVPKNLDPARLAKRAMSGVLRDQSYRDPVAALSPRHRPNIQFVNQERKH